MRIPLLNVFRDQQQNMDDLVQIRQERAAGSILKFGTELTDHILVFGDVDFVLVAFYGHSQLSFQGESVGPDMFDKLFEFADLFGCFEIKIVLLG